jgi:hypothetical protein
MSIIQGNKFIRLSHFTYAPPPGTEGNVFKINDYRHLVSTFEVRKLKDNDIIYTHTFFVKSLFRQLSKLDKKVTVITHNCDTVADAIPPDNVKIWFTTNVNVTHERVQSIPIGLENDRWYPEKKLFMASVTKKKKEFKKMLYLNHNIATNPSKRQAPYDALEGKPWVSSIRGINGQGIKEYIDDIYNHPFVVCPEGNGIDTHRVWECLYVGTIPVQIRNINNQFYTDLPILFINDWSELTEKFLADEYMKITSAPWNIKKLEFEYWQNEIKSGHTVLQ